MNDMKINLRELESDILGRWRNRIEAHAGEAVPALFQRRTKLGIRRRLSWSVEEGDQRAKLKDLQLRKGLRDEMVADLPLGRELRIDVSSGRKFIGRICASYAFPHARFADGAMEPLSFLDWLTFSNTQTGGPDYTVVAGWFDRLPAEIPSRMAVVNWNAETNTWEYRAGSGADCLWRLFHPSSDEEFAESLRECVSRSGSGVILLSRALRETGLRPAQVLASCALMPDARLEMVSGRRVLSLAGDSQ
jgi:hypothetical protein